MNQAKLRLLLLFSCFITVTSVLAQKHHVSIIDAKTGQPVAFAHLTLQIAQSDEVQHFLSDIDGKVPVSITRPALLQVSYVGYETFADSLQPSVDKVIQLVPAVLNLNEFVVTAQMNPGKADRSIYKIQVINSRQIEAKAATNLTDLLSTESNVRISQDGVLGSSLSLQGLSGENVKFLVDGVPVVGRLNGNIDLNQLNLYNVDHIEVIEGPMSVIYGSNAIAGVVNIITKENKNAALTGSVNALYETVGVYNFNAGSSIRHKRNLFSVNVSRNFFDGFSTNDSLRSMPWKPRRQINGDVFYLFSGTKIRVKAAVQLFDEIIQDKGNLRAPYFETAFDDYFNTIRQTSKIESSYTINSSRQLNLVAAYSTFLRKHNLYYNDLTIAQKQLAGGDTTSVGSILVRAWYNRNYQENTLNYQFGFDANVETNTGERIADGAQQIGDYAAFLSLKYEPFKKLTIQPGARLTYNTKYKAPLVYSVNMRSSLTPHTSIRATYARGFRAPSLKELYLDFVDINHNLHGNPDLKAESSHNFNLNFGYQRETKRTFFNNEIGVFYNLVDNMIWLFQVGNDITNYTYGNVSKFVSTGVQANTTISFYPTLTLRAGISHVGRKFPESNGAGSNSFKYSTDFNTMATYKLNKPGISFTANYKYTGRFPQLSPDGEFENQYIEGYSNLDFSVVKFLFKDKLSVSVGGKNLLDVKDVKAGMANTGVHTSGDGASRIAWGRSYFVKFTYNFTRF